LAQEGGEGLTMNRIAASACGVARRPPLRSAGDGGRGRVLAPGWVERPCLGAVRSTWTLPMGNFDARTDAYRRRALWFSTSSTALSSTTARLANHRSGCAPRTS